MRVARPAMDTARQLAVAVCVPSHSYAGRVDSPAMAFA